MIGATAGAQIQYLSGHGKDDPVAWDFMADQGQNAGKWAKIAVPSNWELQGFGIYTYGRVPPATGWPRVHGIYTRSFTTPVTWNGKTVFVHFEGVMTDTQVTVNGQSAGPVHQGGYYAFKYDITRLLKPAGQENEIQVDVDDESHDESVNHAERRGDFWNYGGIFRPVYLEAVPKRFVDHLAINATAAGSLAVDVWLADTRGPTHSAAASSVEMRVLDLHGKPVSAPIRVNDVAFDVATHLTGKLAHPKLWTAETPNLYDLEVRLKSGITVIQTVHQRFGFRTIELRPGKGMFVNGRRIFLKGVARHSFWPDSGRTLSEQISRDDINLIKNINGNTARSTHYPPDRHFLDACDELGLYVLDELTGWQAHYDTGIGKKLVREMVEHDVNHPSILFWDNGNEGGFNFDLDPEYAKYDPQHRTVLHPWAAYPPGIADTKHYPNYELLQQKLAADPVFFPTEMLHGLYDGGAGAGLADYWDAIMKSKAGAGGVIWSFVDEDVKRTDKGGILDSERNFAPDGIVGPYREREGSFYAVRQIWSPIIVTRDEESRSYTVTNRYSFLNADQCTFEWQDIRFSRPGDTTSGSVVVRSQSSRGRSLAPASSATRDHWGPSDGGGATSHNDGRAMDAHRLLIKDNTGRLIRTYVWPVKGFQRRLDTMVDAAQSSANAPAATESGDTLTIGTGGLSLRISKVTGLLVSATREGQTFSLTNGPRVVAMSPRNAPPRRGDPAKPVVAPSFAPESKLTSLTHSVDGSDLLVTASFNGPLQSMVYRLRPDGWLTVNYVYAVTGPHEYFGVGFDYPEDNLSGIRFLGEGPSPVYQNRLAGGILDVWQRAYNNTIVGDPDDLKPGEHFTYPVFKGYYAGMRWLELKTPQGPITAVVNQQQEAPIYVQILSPKYPPADLAGQTIIPFPKAGISFLNAIPAVGSKFGAATSTGPMGQPAVGKGEYKGQISLYFGPLSR
jgi:hypothetical protein